MNNFVRLSIKKYFIAKKIPLEFPVPVVVLVVALKRKSLWQKRRKYNQ